VDEGTCVLCRRLTFNWPWCKGFGVAGFLEAGDTQMQGLNPRTGPVSPILVASILLFGSAGHSWSQEKIGDAQTILNNVEGNLPTGKKVPVAQGDAVFVSEAVSSGADSKANLVLNDKSNVTIGPGSIIKLDDFVYSGPDQRGTVALSVTNGTLRFTSGDANKRAYTIWTPTAAIGVRGTSLRIKATSTQTQVINEDGMAIVCVRNNNESVEELRRSCKGGEEDLAIGTEGRNRSCPCTELLLPSEEATVTASELGVTQAPAYAISEPFIGSPKDFSVTDADLPTKKAPLAPVPVAAEGFPIWPFLAGGALLAGGGIAAAILTQPSSSTPFVFFSP
jgi:FecR protein